MLRHTELSGNGGQIGGGRGAHRRCVATEPAAVCAAGGAAAGQGAPRAALRQRTRQGAAARGRAQSDQMGFSNCARPRNLHKAHLVRHCDSTHTEEQLPMVGFCVSQTDTPRSAHRVPGHAHSALW